MAVVHLSRKFWYTPPSERVPKTMRPTVPRKTTHLDPLSADLISLRKPHGQTCRKVVNRHSFRELRFGQFVERCYPLHGFPEASILLQIRKVVLFHRVSDRLDLLLHRQPFIGCPWLWRRPCFKHPRRPIHGGIFNRNSDHPNLPPLLAERIPKRPMRGSPRVEFGICRVARIDVGKGDDFRVHGKGQFERKVALLVASHTVVNPARNEPFRQADLFKKLDVLVDQARGTFISGGGRHTVRSDLPPDLPQVMADRQRLVQVLNNLLANAARHSPESAPIRIAAEREGLDVAVSVADEGRGIAPDQLGQLFRKYSTAGDRAGGLGSGLGLAICKGLVEAQGGRIRAESGGVGLGARFTFTIPVAEAAGDSPAPARPGPPGHAPEAVPILVVDDDPETLRHLRDTLAEAGYAPLVTGDPGAVARLIGAEKPRLVLLDLMLPGTDGIELMQSVPELSDLPVIFISGYGRDETIARALEAGAEDYVVKPFSPTELTARIRAALRRRSNPVPFVLGDLAIDYDRRRVTVAGRPVTLTQTEYELLRALAQGAGQILTHEDLLRQVWARRGHGKVNPKIVRAYVKRLRHRLGDDAARPAWIVNERGVGYRMARPGEAGEP